MRLCRLLEKAGLELRLGHVDRVALAQDGVFEIFAEEDGADVDRGDLAGADELDAVLQGEAVEAAGEADRFADGQDFLAGQVDRAGLGDFADDVDAVEAGDDDHVSGLQDDVSGHRIGLVVGGYAQSELAAGVFRVVANDLGRGAIGVLEEAAGLGDGLHRGGGAQRLQRHRVGLADAAHDEGETGAEFHQRGGDHRLLEIIRFEAAAEFGLE